MDNVKFIEKNIYVSDRENGIETFLLRITKNSINIYYC